MVRVAVPPAHFLIFDVNRVRHGQPGSDRLFQVCGQVVNFEFVRNFDFHGFWFPPTAAAPVAQKRKKKNVKE